MINLLEVEKNFLIPHIKKGGVAVDFTMGNGHDTLWLSNAVGENGKVYAFDIQPQALESSKKPKIAAETLEFIPISARIEPIQPTREEKKAT